MIIGMMWNKNEGDILEEIIEAALSRVDTLFVADDGSTPGGFGTCRYEQTLLSIFVRLLKLPVMPPDGWMNLTIDGKQVPFHMHWHYRGVIPQTNIFQSRTGLFYKFFDKVRYKGGA